MDFALIIIAIFFTVFIAVRVNRKSKEEDISAIEKALGKKAKMNMQPLQPGDVPDTYANVDDVLKNFNSVITQ